MLAESAPVTFHDRFDVPAELIIDGLLLNSMITGGVPTGWDDTELTIVTADLVTVPAELVALTV
jgi:hypothetical protein